MLRTDRDQLLRLCGACTNCIPFNSNYDPTSPFRGVLYFPFCVGFGAIMGVVFFVCPALHYVNNLPVWGGGRIYVGFRDTGTVALCAVPVAIVTYCQCYTVTALVRRVISFSLFFLCDSVVERGYSGRAIMRCLFAGH